jgi:hypothetical protein
MIFGAQIRNRGSLALAYQGMYWSKFFAHLVWAERSPALAQAQVTGSGIAFGLRTRSSHLFADDPVKHK